MSIQKRFITENNKYKVIVEIDRGVIDFVEYREIGVYACGHRSCSMGFEDCLKNVFEIMAKYDQDTFKNLLDEIKESKYYEYGCSLIENPS